MKIVGALLLTLAIAAVLACPNEKYCRQCGIDGKGSHVCLLCDNGYYDVKENKCVQKDLQESQTCLRLEMVDAKLECRECRPGFVATLDGKCEICQKKDCAFCNLNQECTACKSRQIWQGDKCDEAKSCPDVDCEICSSWGVQECLVCKADFAINEDKKCVKNKSDCELVNAKGECLRCRAGNYIGYGGSCNTNNASMILAIILWSLVGLAFIGILVYFYRDWATKYQYNPDGDAGYTTV
jgi:hypothetical protein